MSEIQYFTVKILKGLLPGNSVNYTFKGYCRGKRVPRFDQRWKEQKRKVELNYRGLGQIRIRPCIDACVVTDDYLHNFVCRAGHLKHTEVSRSYEIFIG